MTREELIAAITPLSAFEEEKKKSWEKTGQLYRGVLDHVYQKDAAGDFVLSNEIMADLSATPEDPIHRTFYPPALRRRLRLILHSRYAEIPFHHTEFISIHYVLEGQLAVTFSDHRTIRLQKGQLILMNSGITHSLRFASDRDIVMGVQIERDYLGTALLFGFRGSGPAADFLIRTMTGEPSAFSFIIAGFEQDERMRDLFLDMFCEAMEVRLDSRAMLENYMRILLLSIIRADSSIVRTGGRADLAAVFSYMESHYRDCTLQGLAEQFHFNEKYLGNLIRKKTGQTFRSHLESIRLQRAAFLLESTSLPIDRIAADCGCTNLSFFYRRFRERFQQTPAAYRAAMQRGSG